MESRDIASPSHKTTSLPKCIWVSVLTWVIAFLFQNKICPLIIFSSLNRSSPSSVDQLHILDLAYVRFGSLLSHNLITQIQQGLRRSHFSTRILGPQKLLDKGYYSNIGLSILLALPQEPITVLLKQVSHIIESLLWIGSGNHPPSIHWSIHSCDSSYIGSPPIGESP